VATALVAPVAHTTKADPTGTALKRAIRRLTKTTSGPPGAIAIVQRQGERRMVFKAGFANLAPTERPHPTDHMRIASVAKAFSGAVALALVDEERLTLDTTLGERLPDMPGPWLSVTLRDLLNHTSGIPNYTADPDFLAFISANPQASIAHRDLIDFVADEPLHFAPGTAYEYSNTDNIIVALMAEAATGDTYENLLATRVFAPLGMHDTTLPSDSALPEPFIHGYDVGEDTPPEDVSTVLSVSSVWASGGIQSTPADLNRFARGYVGGALFSKEERTQQFQFVEGGSSEPPGPGENSAGLALFKYRTPCGVVFGHTGNFPGYTQFMAATRNGQTSVTVSVNEQLSPGTGDPVAFQRLFKVEKLAVCTALARAR
jgi:D-alanyl-D-alanine carboxypeptidase